MDEQYKQYSFYSPLFVRHSTEYIMAVRCAFDFICRTTFMIRMIPTLHFPARVHELRFLIRNAAIWHAIVRDINSHLPLSHWSLEDHQTICTLEIIEKRGNMFNHSISLNHSIHSVFCNKSWIVKGNRKKIAKSFACIAYSVSSIESQIDCMKLYTIYII